MHLKKNLIVNHSVSHAKTDLAVEVIQVMKSLSS